MRLKRPEGMNIIPFIDIMLVLLAIVLTISTFIAQSSIDIELPKANLANQNSQNNSHEILINQKGELYLNETLLSLEALQSSISKIDKSDTIHIKADKQSPFGTFIDVIDYLKAMEYPHVSILVIKK
jgi:biopolymer transport protein ExbD